MDNKSLMGALMSEVEPPCVESVSCSINTEFNTQFANPWNVRVWGEENYDGSYEITLNESCGRVISFTCTPNKATLGSSELSFSVDCLNGQGSDHFSLVCNTLNGVVSANITVVNFT